jgi:hypothetical protein
MWRTATDADLVARVMIELLNDRAKLCHHGVGDIAYSGRTTNTER